MMVKKHLGAMLGVVCVLFTLIVSIVAYLLLNGSTAWFAENKEVDAGGMQVTVESGIGVEVSLKSHPVTEIEGNEYTIPSRDVESYEIPTHDPSSISYSQYKKALAVIITVDAHVDSTVSICLYRDETSGVDTITTPGVSNYISNCMKITPAEIAEGGVVATKGAELSVSTFVDLNSDPITKRESITLVEHAPVYADRVNEFCFIIEYDLDLLGYIEEGILAQHLNDNEVTYFGDIDFRVFE